MVVIVLRSTLFVLVVCLALVSLGQTPPMETDRPDQTESPSIVPVGWLQLEVGAQRERLLFEDGTVEVNTLPTTLTKLGLAPWAELRIIAEREEVRTLEGTRMPGAMLPLEVGTKVRLAGESGLRPRTSLIAHVGIPPIASSEARTSTAFGNFRFTMQNTLSDRFSLGYNVGAEWDGDTPTTTLIYTIGLGAKLSDSWSAFGEVYGFLSDMDPSDHRVDGGFMCLLGDNVQLDASGGYSVGREQWFLSGGISFRLALFAPDLQAGQ